MRRTDPIEVQVWRGPTVESRHLVAASVCDAAGVELARYGDPDVATCWRSAAKPFQALPWVRAGVAERYGWGDREVAIMCASHVGSDEHVQLVCAMLADLGLTEADLQCDEGELRARHNCSGNHTGFLAGCRLNGWETATYRAADHPAQRAALAATAEAAGCAVDDLALATDGCGIVVCATPVTALARAFARLPAIAPRVAAAMRAHPVLIEGAGEPDTVIMQGFPGLISKAGAEGVGCASLPDGRGVAVKVLDGNDRATGPALAALLARCCGLDDVPASVVPVARPAVRNDHHDAVGEIVAVLR
jgi:L-asparaginase II